MKKMVCHKCQHTNEYEPPLARKDECTKCGWDLHVCLNCAFYDRSAHHECREPQAEWVRDKEKSNFCDYFVSKEDGTNPSQPLSGIDALEALFKK